MTAPLANNPPTFPEPPAGLPPTPIVQSSASVGPGASSNRQPRPPAPPDNAPQETPEGWSERFGAWLADSGVWAWLSSALVHAAIVVILSLIVLATPTNEPLWVMGGFDEAVTDDDMELDLSDVPLEGVNPSLDEFEMGSDISLPGERAATVGGNASPTAGSVTSIASNTLVTATAPEGTIAAGSLESLSNPLASRGGGLEGRNLQNRRAAALSGGGSAQSEAAVEAALAWFAEHQCPDGSWNFDLEKCPKCAGYCKPSGTHTSRTAATGLALLSFLGAGYTHQDGKYKDVVGDGLYFLREQMTITTFGGDLRDKKAALETELPRVGLLNPTQLASARRDSMYSHGIATLAITEAFAMTRDQEWREPAAEAIKFIVSAQYEDGGWRYEPRWETPRQQGDMTVTGWQVMALKSATLAGIEVPYDVWMKLGDFLESIQDDGGATYYYLNGEGRGTAATTAVGLLCRMVNGWPREHRPLQRGSAKLGDQLPTRNNMYFNYYSSQVLHHMGGANWEKWNPRMREYLVKTQATDGHEAGSWYFAESHSTSGGRLYTTAMATMTLEVYYRYMPMYKDAFVKEAP